MTSAVLELEGDNLNVVARVLVVSKPGFSGEVVTNRRKRDETHAPTAGVLRVGMTAR